MKLGLKLPTHRWLPAAVGFGLWCVVAGSSTLWWLHVPRTESAGIGAKQASLLDMKPASSQPVIERALGLGATTVAVGKAPERFRLLGLISNQRGEGTALISVGSEPPRPFLTGQPLSEGLTIHAIETNRVVLTSARGEQTVLDLPEPK